MPSMRTMVANVGRAITKAAEGAFRPGPYILPVSGGWLPDAQSLVNTLGLKSSWNMNIGALSVVH